MIAAIHRVEKTEDFLKDEFNVKGAMYVILSVWKDVEKSTVTNASAILSDEDEPTDEYFEGFCATNEQMMISICITYVTSVLLDFQLITSIHPY